MHCQHLTYDILYPNQSKLRFSVTSHPDIGLFCFAFSTYHVFLELVVDTLVSFLAKLTPNERLNKRLL